MARTTLSLAEARPVCLAAQDFDRPRPEGAPHRRHIRQVIHQLGLLQLVYQRRDFVDGLLSITSATSTFQ